MRPSRRASFTPRQKCSAIPKARWGLGLRWMSNCWGSVKTNLSRLAEVCSQAVEAAHNVQAERGQRNPTAGSLPLAIDS